MRDIWRVVGRDKGREGCREGRIEGGKVTHCESIKYIISSMW